VVPAAIDDLLIGAVPALLEDLRPDGWFVLRFIDAHGPHLRLRLRSREPAMADELAEAALERCADAVADLRLDPVRPARRPLVPYIGAPPIAPTHWTLGAETVAYEPEHEVYGGEAGVAIHERLSQVSSAVALDVLARERAGGTDRKSIAPALLDAAYGAFALDARPASFWGEHAEWWLAGYGPAAEDWRERFAEPAAVLASSGGPLARECDGESATAIGRFAEGVAQAAADWGTDGMGAPGGRDRLAHLAGHLMLNRLGFLPLDEAYLATLLQAAARECDAVG
jgi:hypothetical protein